MQRGPVGTWSCLKCAIGSNLFAYGAIAFMAAADERIQELQEEVSELKLCMKEQGDEINDLRELCNQKGIQYEDWVAARRHGRYFAQLRDDHAIGTAAPASDLLGAAPIVEGIAEYVGSVNCTVMIARAFVSAWTQLTAAFPWKFGYCMRASLEGHEGRVKCLAKLEGERLASGWRAAVASERARGRGSLSFQTCLSVS